MREVGIKSYVSQNFYKEYNYFVEQYNEDQNRIGENYMTKLKCLVFTTMPCACCYCVWAGLSVGFGISVLTFFYNFFRFMTLIGIVYNLIVNKNKVPNPFKRMIYCKGLKNANAYYRITTDIYDHKIQELGVSIDSFHFALSQVQSSTQSLILDVMFYRDEFMDYYSLAPRVVCFDLCVTSTLLFFNTFCAIGSITYFVSKWS